MIRYEGVPQSREGVALCLRIGAAAARYVTRKFEVLTGTRDIRLAIEKVLWPYVIFKKKRYAGRLWTEDTLAGRVEPYVDAKGIETKRRDSWLGLRRTLGDALEQMLMHMNLEQAKCLLLTLLEQLVHDKLPLADYVMSKSLKKHYDASKAPPPHVAVRDRIARRAPGSEPKSGNRIAYVIVQHRGERVDPLAAVRRLREKRDVATRANNKAPRTSEKAECAEYAREHPTEARIDRMYYVCSLVRPFCTLLEPCFARPELLFEDAVARIARQRAGLRDITRMLEPVSGETPVEPTLEQRAERVPRRDESAVYVPQHVRDAARKQKRKVPPGAGGMLRFCQQ